MSLKFNYNKKLFNNVSILFFGNPLNTNKSLDYFVKNKSFSHIYNVKLNYANKQNLKILWDNLIENSKLTYKAILRKLKPKCNNDCLKFCFKKGIESLCSTCRAFHLLRMELEKGKNEWAEYLSTGRISKSNNLVFLIEIIDIKKRVYKLFIK